MLNSVAFLRRPHTKVTRGDRVNEAEKRQKEMTPDVHVCLTIAASSWLWETLRQTTLKVPHTANRLTYLWLQLVGQLSVPTNAYAKTPNIDASAFCFPAAWVKCCRLGMVVNLTGNHNYTIRETTSNWGTRQWMSINTHTQRLGLFNETELCWGTTMLHKKWKWYAIQWRKLWFRLFVAV